MADNAVADTATPHFAFIGQPSRNTTVVSVWRAVGAVIDFLGIDFGTQIAPLMAFDHPPSFTVSGLDVRRDDFAGQPVYMIRSDSPSGKYVVALHGGAYVVQPTINHWSAYAAIARRTHATVIVPIYPLASTPQGRAQTVIPDMADLISAQIAAHGADNVSVYGDSAGGGMALSVAQLLVNRGEPTPSRMVLISPWLDVTMSNPAIASINDPVLRTASLRKAGQQWAGDLSLTDPLVSPIYGSLAGLPPTAVYCGNLDLLAADVLRLREQALATAPAISPSSCATVQFMTGPWAVPSARRRQPPCNATSTASWASPRPAYDGLALRPGGLTRPRTPGGCPLRLRSRSALHRQRPHSLRRDSATARPQSVRSSSDNGRRSPTSPTS